QPDPLPARLPGRVEVALGRRRAPRGADGDCAMRVTDNMRVGSALTNLSSLRSQHLRATREASTGLRVLAPSDDPAAAARLTRIQRMQSDGEAISRSLAMGRIDLELAEGTLASSAELMKRAKELAMTASNDSLPADARANIADEVASIREALRG